MTNKSLLLLTLSLFCHSSFPQVIPVSVEQLGDLRVARELRAPATVLSLNSTVITSELTALIEEVLVDVGSSVEKNAVLVRLDSDNARLALAQARTRLDAIDAQIIHSQQRLARAEELFTSEFISDDELIGRQTELAVLQADHQGQLVAIQIAELALARTHIRAPFDANVVQRQAQVGNYAQPGTQLLKLVQTDQREVDAELDPRYANHVARALNLRYEDQSGQYPIELLRLTDVIETDTRKLRARFGFIDTPASIGSSGEVAWTENSGLVPATLIVQRGSSYGVFAARNDKAVFIEIPSAQEGRPAALDLPDDTLIVSRGHARLQNGDDLLITTE